MIGSEIQKTATCRRTIEKDCEEKSLGGAQGFRGLVSPSVSRVKRCHPLPQGKEVREP